MMLFPKCASKSSDFQIYRFQNLPAKHVPFAFEWEPHPSHFFTIFKMCWHPVNIALNIYKCCERCEGVVAPWCNHPLTLQAE